MNDDKKKKGVARKPKPDVNEAAFAIVKAVTEKTEDKDKKLKPEAKN